MGKRQSRPFLGLHVFSLSPALVISSLLPQLPVQSYPQLQVSLEFPVDNVGKPEGGSVAGGTRGGGSCSPGETPLTALVPKSYPVLTTISPHPKIFVYVPQTELQLAEFVVSDKQNNHVYQTKVALTGSSGIVQLSLPTTVSLEVGKEYLWRFKISCDSQGSNENKLIWGSIWRTEISPELEKQLEQVKLQQQTALYRQAQLYANAGVWGETLATVAQLRNYCPLEWEELLNSVGLNQLAQKPFLKCCTIEN